MNKTPQQKKESYMNSSSILVTAIALLVVTTLTGCLSPTQEDSMVGQEHRQNRDKSPDADQEGGPQTITITRPEEKKYPGYQESDLGSPTDLVWVPKYELPQGSRESGWSEWLVFAPGRAGDISILIDRVTRPWQERSLNLLRDDLYNFRYCEPQAGMDYADSLINCAKGFKKGELTLGGKKIYYLQYWSAPSTPAGEIREILFQSKNFPVKLTVEGDFETAKPTLERMISTMTFSHEKYEYKKYEMPVHN